MKKLFSLSLTVIVLLCGCGSTKSSLFNRDPSFSRNDFFNNSITIYPPLSVSVSNNKYADYKKEDIKSDVTKLLKEKIERVSTQANVVVGKGSVPSYFRGILIDKDAAKQFIRKAKSKYLVFIQQVLVGESSEMQSINNNLTGLPYSYSQSKTKTTIYFDIWNKDTKTSIFSMEVRADINDGLLVNSLNSSFSNAIDEFINSINKE